jgi:hypothetical protein
MPRNFLRAADDRLAATARKAAMPKWASMPAREFMRAMREAGT